MLTFDACADNRALLAKFGVRLAYPHFSLAPLASEQGNIPMASFKEYLLSQSAEGKSCDTLLLIMPGAFLLQDKLSLLCRALVECFPKADIEAFVSLARQDVVLESAAVFGVLQGPMPLNGKFREWVIAEQQGYFHYLAPLAALFETLGKKHVRCLVEATDPMAHLVAQASLWVHMGVNLPEDKATELAVIPPILALDLPQEFCLFCNASNMLRTTWYPPFSSPWNSQTRYFSGVDTRVNGLFNPAERAGLVESCERENMVVAKLLGGKALFEPVPPEKTIVVLTG